MPFRKSNKIRTPQIRFGLDTRIYKNDIIVKYIKKVETIYFETNLISLNSFTSENIILYHNTQRNQPCFIEFEFQSIC